MAEWCNNYASSSRFERRDLQDAVRDIVVPLSELSELLQHCSKGVNGQTPVRPPSSVLETCARRVEEVLHEEVPIVLAAMSLAEENYFPVRQRQNSVPTLVLPSEDRDIVLVRHENIALLSENPRSGLRVRSAVEETETHGTPLHEVTLTVQVWGAPNYAQTIGTDACNIVEGALSAYVAAYLLEPECFGSVRDTLAPVHQDSNAKSPAGGKSASSPSLSSMNWKIHFNNSRNKAWRTSTPRFDASTVKATIEAGLQGIGSRDDPPRITRALRLHALATRSKDSQEAMLAFNVAALEALFADSERKIGKQLRQRIGALIATHVSEVQEDSNAEAVPSNPQDEKTVRTNYRKVRDTVYCLYGQRSCLAHGGHIDQYKLKQSASIANFLSGYAILAWGYWLRRQQRQCEVKPEVIAMKDSEGQILKALDTRANALKGSDSIKSSDLDFVDTAGPIQPLPFGWPGVLWAREFQDGLNDILRRLS
ncbi:MAG: hypothetical protein K8R92_04825 [Planctomycetes bacterium]|nr:hypothetical protein [Planctomycetota bacterium]